MPPTLEERAAAIEKVARATKEMTPEVQLAAQRALNALDPPDRHTTKLLWLIFVPAMVGLALVFGVFAFLLLYDGKESTDPDLMAQALTFVLGALAGLFVRSPVQSGTGGGEGS